jgi:hypothetical protein
MSIFPCLSWTLTAAALLLSISTSAKAEVPAPPPEARVTFRSGSEHLAIYRRSYTSSSWVSVGRVTGGGIESAFQRICVAPCEASLPAGTDTYSVSRTSNGEEYPRSIGAITVPPGSATVDLVYRDRRFVRRVGKLIMFTGFIGGLVYSGVQLAGHAECDDDEACERRRLVGAGVGLGVALGSFGVGRILAGIDDVVDVNITRQNRALDSVLPRARELSLRTPF